MFEYMDRFGFNADPELAYPGGQLSPSGVYDGKGNLLGPDDSIDIGRVAIGQGPETSHVEATPLQMAEVAAAIANGGVLMGPTFVQEITDPDGRTSEELDPSEQSRSQRGDRGPADGDDDQRDRGGDGRRADRRRDFVCGQDRHGGDQRRDQPQPALVHRLPPADDPQVAVAVTLDRCTGCFGGDAAGPIATAVMESLLG